TATIATSSSACSQLNGVATVTANGGVPPYTYLWNDPAGQTTQTATGLYPGLFIVEVTDTRGCSDTFSVQIMAVPPPQVDSVESTQPICSGAPMGTATVYASLGVPPYQYLWSDPNAQTAQTAVGLYAGTYTVTVTDAGGCSTTGTVTIYQPNTLLAVVATNRADICIGQTTQLFANGVGGTPPYIYTWNQPGLIGSGPHTLSPTSTTIYSVYITDANGCQSLPETVTITVAPPITVQMTDAIGCDGEMVEVTASAFGGNGGPYVFSWSNGFTGPSQYIPASMANSPQTLFVTVDDGCSISATDSMVLTVMPKATATMAIDTTVGCGPLTVTFNGGSDIGVDYIWDFGDGSAPAHGIDQTHVYEQQGVYDVTLTVVTADGCKTKVEQLDAIEVYATPTALFEHDPIKTSILNPTVYFTNQSTGADAYYWDFGATADPMGTSTAVNPVYIYPDTGRFTIMLVAINSLGCTDTTYSTVIITPSYTYYPPTGFSPNGDGKNDYWIPKGVGIDPNNFDLKIYDRWGHLVHSGSTLYDVWDGNVRNTSEKAQQGVYVYKSIVYDWLGNRYEYQGRITLIR
ncbi:MAG: PKD domain-containing protein, partial [Bacteroidia bacterium]|nr:gliding motility-associated C-terminal domain-containing protein [Bacteroidia bacterium]NNM16240.1 PKD domain-containing protein [Bacteroidia bacterium]